MGSGVRSARGELKVWPKISKGEGGMFPKAIAFDDHAV